MASSPDPYDDGYAFNIELARPATDADVAACHEAESWWLEAYCDEDRWLIRNSGIRAEQGAMRFVIYADRIDDPGGPAAARARASSLISRLHHMLPGARVTLTSAEAEIDADFLERAGTRVIRVEPQGLLVQALHGELKPAWGWLVLPIAPGWIFHRLVHSGSGAMVALALGFLTLSFVSRARTSRGLVVAGGAIALLALLEAIALAAGFHHGVLPTLHMVLLAAMVGWGFWWAGSGT